MGDDQDRRRSRLLARAKEKRSQRCARLLESSLFVSATDEDSASSRIAVEPSASAAPVVAVATASFRKPTRVAAAARAEAHALQVPTWMVGSVPADLGFQEASAFAASLDAGSHGWFVIPRPSGMQCLVVASRDGAVARDEGGNLMVRFRSFLQPGRGAAGARRGAGGGVGGGGSSGVTVLDCIFEEATQVFHVVDALVWEGTPCHEWPFEMRRFWLQSNLPACGADRVVVPSGWRRALVSGRKGNSTSRRGSGGEPTLSSAASSDSVAAFPATMVTDAASASVDATAIAGVSLPRSVSLSSQTGAASDGSSSARSASGPVNEYAFALLPHYECSMAGLRAAYETASLAAPDAAGGRYSAASAVTPQQAELAPKSYVSVKSSLRVGSIH